MRNLIIISLLLVSISSCCKKEEFFDKNVSSHGWALHEVKDVNDNIIIEKPDSLPQDIYFFFSNDFKVIGHLASFKIDNRSSYSITEEGSFVIDNLFFPRLIIKYDWDRYFIDNFSKINKYEYDSNQRLILYFGVSNSKFIFISK